LHNLVNGPWRLTNSKPNPKMQYLNTKMIYQVQETCESISYYWPKHEYFILFTKNKSQVFCIPICGYCKIWQMLWRCSFWDTCASIAFVGKIESFFLMTIYATITNVGKANTIGHKWQVHGSQCIWVTMHMIHKT